MTEQQHQQLHAVNAMGCAHAQLPHMGSLDASNNSSSTDLADDHRTHHLLKHCLSDGQRVDALAHFNNQDVKEAAKEISRMGQRELQTKFKLVYGTATHSNNNDWLRRKLYEAIGAAPIKATTKTKARKPAAPKVKRAPPPDHMYGSVTAFNNSVGALERRSRRTPKGTPKGLALAEMLKRPYRPGGSLPSSPMAGRSVLDMHRYLSHDTNTSTSEDESGSWRHRSIRDDGEEVDGSAAHFNNNFNNSSNPSGVIVFSQHRAAVMAALEAQARAKVEQEEQANDDCEMAEAIAAVHAPPPRVPSLTLLYGSSLNLDTMQASDAWTSDAWAENALKAAAARQAPPAAFMPAAEEEDLLLPMDLSVYDAQGTCSLL